ncbi:MAG: hypothetical protein WC284_09610, partial [Candidimonas sp.]
KASHENDVKSSMLDIFVNLTVEQKKRPSNFLGIDDHSQASCEMRKRPTNQLLTDDECSLLDKVGVPYQTTQILEPHYAFNDKLFATLTEKQIEKIDEAIKKAGVDGLIVKLTSHPKKTVSDDTINAIFDGEKIGTNKRLLKLLLPLVTKMTITPKMTDADVKTAIKIVVDAGMELPVEKKAEKKKKGK